MIKTFLFCFELFFVATPRGFGYCRCLLKASRSNIGQYESVWHNGCLWNLFDPSESITKIAKFCNAIVKE